MSTQTEPKLVTQIDFARAGQITPQMKEVAEREHRDPEYIRERVADGRIAIPANIVHIKKGMRAFGVGEGLSTKVNVNLGISGDKADAAEEWKKVKIAEDFGADAIMDLSNSGKTRQFRQQLIDETPLMVGTVPMYDAIGYMEKPLVKLTKDDLFEVVRAHAEDGVDFMTIHCGINKSVTKTFKETGRLMNIVSRGGSLLFGWMEVTGNENPFYEYFDELLEICHEYDVTISLGDSCRPGCLYDSNDATETAEMIELGKLCKRAWAAGVQVMVEGPGHMALDEIAANMKLQKRLCHNAPFYVLGPLVTDIGVGYDHITAAIGGAISASSGADFLCYVTPAEHLCLPNAQDVLDGLMLPRSPHTPPISPRRCRTPATWTTRWARHAASSTGTPCGSARSTQLRARSATRSLPPPPRALAPCVARCAPSVPLTRCSKAQRSTSAWRINASPEPQSVTWCSSIVDV